MFCFLLLWKGTVKVNVGRLVGWGHLTAEGGPNKRLLLFHGLVAPGRGEGWKVLSNESEWRKSVFEVPQEGPLGQETPRRWPLNGDNLARSKLHPRAQLSRGSAPLWAVPSGGRGPGWLQTWCGKGGIPREQQVRRPTVTSRGQHLTPDPGQESSLQQMGTGWSPGRQMPAPSQAPSTVLLSPSTSSPGPARGCGEACRSAGAPAGRTYLPG